MGGLTRYCRVTVNLYVDLKFISYILFPSLVGLAHSAEGEKLFELTIPQYSKKCLIVDGLNSGYDVYVLDEHQNVIHSVANSDSGLDKRVIVFLSALETGTSYSVMVDS